MGDLIPLSKKVNEESQEDTTKDTSEETKENPIYVKVSDETRQIIDKYKEEEGRTISSLIKDAIECFDRYYSMSPEIYAIIEKYKSEDEKDWNFIERALKYYDEMKNPETNAVHDLWMRARDEMNMLLIGKTTFNQLIAAAEAPRDSLDKPFKKNVAIDLILWYNNSQPLKNLTIEKVIETIKVMWVVANYFYTIDVTKQSEDEYHLLFRHHQSKKYSSYWLGYFTELFKSEDMPFKCAIEGQAFDESLSIIIKVGYEK